MPDTAIPDIPFDSSEWFETGEPEYPLEERDDEQKKRADAIAKGIGKKMKTDGVFPLDEADATLVAENGSRKEEPVTAAVFDESQHPRHPAGAPASQGGEFAARSSGLPDGYVRRDRRPIAASTRNRRNWKWNLMMRDLWEGGGYRWQEWGSGHMSSGITNALNDRGLIDIAVGPGNQLYRLTPEGVGELEAWWSEKFHVGEDLPDPPGEWVEDYVRVRSPNEQAAFDEHMRLRAERRAVREARAVENAPRIRELEDELDAFRMAEESRTKMIGTEDEPFIDQQLVEFQRRRAAEIERELRQLRS